MRLSQPQFKALRYAKGRQLYAEDVNEGNGNRKRTLLWLIDHGLLTWDPIYYARVVLTDLGEKLLAEAWEKKLAATRGTIDDPHSRLRVAKRQREDAAKESES